MVLEPTWHHHPYLTLGMVHMLPNGGDGWEAGWELWSSTGSMKRVSSEGAGSTLIHLISLPTQQAQCLKEHNGQPQLYCLLGPFDPVRRHISNIALLKVTLWCLQGLNWPLYSFCKETPCLWGFLCCQLSSEASWNRSSLRMGCPQPHRHQANSPSDVHRDQEGSFWHHFGPVVFTPRFGLSLNTVWLCTLMLTVPVLQFTRFI